MSNKILFIFAGICVLSAGCMSPSGAPGSEGWKLDAAIVSPSETAPPPATMKKGEKVEAKFCTMDAELTKRVGMVDEVTRRALAKSGAKYISQAKYSSPSMGCIQVQGVALK